MTRSPGPRRRGRAGRTQITQAQMARRERRTLAGREGLTEAAAVLGRPYPPGTTPPTLEETAPAAGGTRGRRRPDGHRRAGENAGNGWA